MGKWPLEDDTKTNNTQDASAQQTRRCCVRTWRYLNPISLLSLITSYHTLSLITSTFYCFFVYRSIFIPHKIMGLLDFIWDWVYYLFYLPWGKKGRLVLIGLDNAGKTSTLIRQSPSHESTKYVLSRFILFPFRFHYVRLEVKEVRTISLLNNVRKLPHLFV